MDTKNNNEPPQLPLSDDDFAKLISSIDTTGSGVEQAPKSSRFGVISCGLSVIVLIALGLLGCWQSAFLSFAVFNAGMGIYITTMSLVNAFCYRDAQPSSVYPFWMLYFTTMSSIGFGLLAI